MKAAVPLCLQAAQLNAGGTAQGRTLFQNLNLVIEPGTRWVILGANGAGKTSLMHVLAGLIPLQAGQVLFDQKPLSVWKAGDLARARAWCPQFWHDPFPVRVEEAVSASILALHPYIQSTEMRARVADWLARYDLAHLAHADVRLLSGGERQRVALAGACAQGAPILLLDEPTAHLDWAHQSLLHREWLEWTQHAGSVVAVLHDLNFAWSVATHVLLLMGDAGTLSGPRERVMRAAPLSAAYGAPIQCRDEPEGGRWFRMQAEAGPKAG